MSLYNARRLLVFSENDIVSATEPCVRTIKPDKVVTEGRNNKRLKSLDNNCPNETVRSCNCFRCHYPPSVSSCARLTKESKFKIVAIIITDGICKVHRPQQPCLWVKKWFVKNLVTKGTHCCHFLGRTDDILGCITVVERIFNGYWDLHGPTYYTFVGCWLPALDRFERQDNASGTGTEGLLHSFSERSLLMASFGFRNEFGVPKSFQSLNLNFEDVQQNFLEFTLQSGQAEDPGTWWPSRYDNNIIEILDVHLPYKIKLEPSLFSFKKVASDTHKSMGWLKGMYYNTGVSIYAEGTLQSAINLSVALGEVAGEKFSIAASKQGVLFVDLGAGNCNFVTTIARPRNCPVIGVEVCTNRCLVACTMLLNLSKQNSQSYPYKVGYVPMNIFSLQSLEPPEEISYLVVYLGDEAFDEKLLEKISDLLKFVSVEVILISGKAGRHRCYSHFWESRGDFSLLATVDWNKSGSNELGKHFLYRLLPTPPRQLIMDARIYKAFLACCSKSSTTKTRTEYYEDILHQFDMKTYPLELYGEGKRDRGSRKRNEDHVNFVKQL